MRPLFFLYFRTGLILALIACGFRTLPAQDADGFKFLEVKIVDPDGKPMSDVAVDIDLNGMKFPMPTDNEGLISINIPTGEQSEVSLFVRHEGHVAKAVAWKDPAKVPKSVTIGMQPGVAFGGLVHDERGRPVADVKVSGVMVINKVYGYPTDGSVVPFLDGELATTDVKGRWTCSMAPEGEPEFQLWFSHSEYLEYRPDDFATWQELKSQKKVAVIDKGITLTGQVLDPDGNLLPSALVEITQLDNGGLTTWHEVSNAKGEFRFEGIPRGSLIASAQTAKFPPLKMPVKVESGMEPLTVKLEKGRSIQIRLVDKEGEALSGGRVQIVDWRFYGDELKLGDKSKANSRGLWQWNLIPSGELTYQVSAPGYRSAKHKLVASDKLQEIVLKPAILVRGRVIDKATREPIKKFKLMGVAFMQTDQNVRYVEAFGATDLISSSDYIFRSGILCESFQVSCLADGYKSASSRAIKPDEDEVQWDFELERVK